MIHSWAQALDPRRSLAVRLALGTVIIGLLIIGVVQYFAIRDARRTIEQELGVVQAEYAQQLADDMDSTIDARLQSLQLVAGLIGDERLSHSERRALLDSLQESFPEFAWIGVIAPGGGVTVSTRAILEGQPASPDVWDGQLPETPRVGAVHSGAQLARLLGLGEQGDTSMFVGLSTAVRDKPGRPAAVLSAQLGWGWVRAREAQLLNGLHARRQVESVIAASDGRVLLGPPDLIGRTVDVGAVTLPGARLGYQLVTWPDGNEYLTSHARGSDERAGKSMGWTVFVRERSDSALADANQLQARLVLLGGGASLLFALLIASIVHRITRPINAIARTAELIHSGGIDSRTMPVFGGGDEVARVSRSLNSLVGALDERNRELRALNATLEQRVADRTHQIERMGEENRRAAIVRERLRMARDLHDTLAHTLASVLTQIRLTRKLIVRDQERAAAELERADHAAQQGLKDARAAIANLRSSPVRELGLLDAMRQCAAAFELTNGVACGVETDAALHDLANDDAESLLRIFEESLRNVAQHARATRVDAALRREGPDNRITMTVRDNGIGFDANQPVHGHYGLRGIREQAEIIRAEASITSSPGAGTTVRIALPPDY